MKKKVKINSPFIAAFVIILSTLFIIVSFNDYSIWLKQAFEDEMEADLSFSTKQSANMVNMKFQDTISSLKLLSQTMGMEDNLLNDSSIVNQFSKANKPNGLSIMLPDGTCYLSDGRKLKMTDRPCFQKAMANNIVISQGKEMTPDESSYMMVTVPVCCNFKIVGAVNTVIKMETINELLASAIADEQGITCIMEKNGDIISTSLPEYKHKNIFTATGVSFDLVKIRTDTGNDKSGLIRCDANHSTYYAYYTPIGINDWYIFHTTPTNAVCLKFNQILKYTGYLIMKVFLALLVIGVYAAVCGRKNKTVLRKTNEVLSRTKAELETFIANLPGGAFRYSADEKAEIRFVSDGLLKIFGCTKEEFAQNFSNSFDNMIYGEDRLKTLCKIKQQMEQGNIAEVKYRIVTADGHFHWLLNRAQIVPEENGDSEICAVVVDITDSKQAHKRANDALIQLETLSNNILGGVVQFLYEDGSLTLIYASEGFYKLSGYSKEQYAQHFNKDKILCAYSDDEAGLQFTIKRQIEKQDPIRAEYRLIQKNGGIIWVSLSGTRTVNRHSQITYQCIFTDITSFKKTQEELELERERYQIAESLSDDIMFEYDIVTDYMVFSPLFTALTGLHPHFHNYLMEIEKNESICSADLPEYKVFFKEIGRVSSTAGVEFRCKTRSGVYIWHRIKAKVIYDTYGKPLKAVGKAYNIDIQKTEMQRLTDKSQRDPLTNLYNKIATQSQIEDDLKDKDTGGKHALMVIDIDNFKTINDTFGHLVGDAVITEFSKKIQMLFRTSDVVGRIGGDEFVVFLRGISTDDLMAEKAKAITEISHNIYIANHLDYKISASIGIAMYPTDGTTYQELFPKADLALYRAKGLGKDCYAFYSNELD